MFGFELDGSVKKLVKDIEVVFVMVFSVLK